MIKFFNPNLVGGGRGGGEGGVILPTCWFSLNNSEMVKVATLEFCSIQLHLIRNSHAKFGNPYSPQSPDIGKNSDGGISHFRISV